MATSVISGIISMAIPKKIGLKSLWVNTENYRYEPTESQPEALAIMVADQKDKLYKLAESIAESGMNPIDIPIVTDLPSHPGKFLVLEGNRRVTALKFWSNPDLLKDTSATPSLTKKFRTLNSVQAASIPHKIDCIYFADPNEADKWVRLKHTGENEGIGTVSWNAQQVGRFQNRVGEKASIGLQVIEYLKTQPDFDQSLKAKLSDVKVTTLTRLVADSDVQKVLGISVENGMVTSSVPEKEILKGYTQLVKDLTTKGFSVKNVYTKEQREEYARKFPAASRPDLNSADGSTWPTTARRSVGPTATPASPAGPKKVSTERTTVIPKNCVIPISNPKVNAIYGELQKLKLTEFIQAPSALMRVFIELSLDLYLELHGLTSTPSSTRSGTMLYQKGSLVIEHMTNKGWADAATSLGLKNLLKDKDGILSMETLHAYIHNHRISPTADQLQKTWDSIADFMVALWSNVK